MNLFGLVGKNVAQMLAFVTILAIAMSLMPAPAAAVTNDEVVIPCIVTSKLVNGSFEVPTVASLEGWDVFDSVINGLTWAVTWLNPSGDAPEGPMLELQNGYPASNGQQYAELDSNYTHPGEDAIAGDAAVAISQTVPTQIGVEYTLTYDLSATPFHDGRDNNKVEVYVNDVLVASSTAPASTVVNWTTYSVSFIATASTTKISLTDAGLATTINNKTFGTFIDKVSLTGCEFVDEDDNDNGGGNEDEDTYKIFGYSYDDQDEDDDFDEDEDDLSGWTVKATNTETNEEITDETDESGRYELFVTAGTWRISQETEDGWVQLSDADVDGDYLVTVPEEVEFTLMNWLVPTAHAAMLDEVGSFDFGNDFVGQNRGGSNGGGTRVSSRSPRGQVLGNSTTTPSGAVLGDATSTMPVGAPNTGAGGTTAVVINLPAITAILTTSSFGRKSK